MPCFPCCLVCESTFVCVCFLIIQLNVCRPFILYVTAMIQCCICGTSRNQLVLVSRQSSRRLIFANVEQMRSGREFYLSLRSHGGASIVFIPPRCIGRELGTNLMHLGQYRYVHLGLSIDPNAPQIKAKYNGKFVTFNHLSSNQKVGLDISMGKMFKRNHVNAVRHHSKGPKQDYPSRRWTLNNDGSLSPMDAPHLALGDLFFSGFDPDAVVVATAVAMTDMTDVEHEAIPVAKAYSMSAP